MLRGASLQVLLGIIPGAAGVGHADSHLHTADQRTGKHACQAAHAKQDANNDRGAHDQHTWGDHLAQAGIGGDGDAALVVRAHGAVHDAGGGGKLAAHLFHHSQRSLAHALHGHGGEPVWQHGADQQAEEDVSIQDGGILESDTSTGDIGAKQGKRHQSGGTDGKALPDGGGGVAGAVQGVSALADVLAKAGHLSNATGIVADGAVRVNGQANGHGGEHAQRSASNAVHAGKGESDIDADGNNDAGNDGALVAQGQAEDDVCGSAGAAGIGDVAHRLEGMAGVVLRHKADDEAAPQAGAHADGDVVPLDGGVHVPQLGKNTGELIGQQELGQQGHQRGHHHGGHNQLHLESRLDVGDALGRRDVGGQQRGEQAAHNAER
mmetsp:Transcript_25204/g.65429  ORF Transcript_25204/g.65429 Transcript_25204/m.65429 type:complete len:379 (+) Transcript_25204:434-1570(+)